MRALHFELEEIADATLTLLVDQVLAVVEAAVLVLLLLDGFAMGNRHLLAIKSDEDILGRI